MREKEKRKNPVGTPASRKIKVDWGEDDLKRQ